MSWDLATWVQEREAEASRLKGEEIAEIVQDLRLCATDPLRLSRDRDILPDRAEADLPALIDLLEAVNQQAEKDDAVPAEKMGQEAAAQARREAQALAQLKEGLERARLSEAEKLAQRGRQREARRERRVRDMRERRRAREKTTYAVRLIQEVRYRDRHDEIEQIFLADLNRLTREMLPPRPDVAHMPPPPLSA